MISIVKAPEESDAENLDIERANDDEVVLVSLDERFRTNAILSRTLIIAFKLDCKTSTLFTKNSIDPSSNPPVMSTAVATSISPDVDMTSTSSDAADISVLIITESFWLKIVI